MGNTNTLLTVKQAAIQMDCKPITIRRWIKSGKIPAYQLGGPKGHLHIPVEALPQFHNITEQRNGQSVKDLPTSIELPAPAPPQVKSGGVTLRL